MLYGESGAGKSSLVNAGLIPAAEAEGFDFRVDRIRVQPHLQHELVVERIAVTPDSASFLPSSFAGDADGSQIVLSIEAFRAQLDRALSMKVRPLLIFDQFEELITLFEEARGEGRRDAREAQLRIVGMLVELLLHQTMPVKLVFSFREDYLAQVKELLALSPELVNQSLRLTPPPTDALYEIIRDPFEKHPGHFGHELMPELAHRLSAELASRSPSGAINLSEMQIVCLRLWESSDPEALLEHGGVQAVLEDYLEESLNRFPQELHYPAVALLSQLVTATGVRNIVAREDLIQRVRSEEPDIPEERVEAALGALESETRLVRRERRGDLDLFEISSEFLVPWIGRQRADRLRAREQAREPEEAAAARRRARRRRGPPCGHGRNYRRRHSCSADEAHNQAQLALCTKGARPYKQKEGRVGDCTGGAGGEEGQSQGSAVAEGDREGTAVASAGTAVASAGRTVASAGRGVASRGRTVASGGRTVASGRRAVGSGRRAVGSGG